MNTVNVHESKEADIIHMIHQKDDAFFAVLYKHYWALMLHHAGNYIADTDACKEIVQDLFVSLHRKRDRLRIRVSFSAYLYSSLRNKIINYLRDEWLYKKHCTLAGKSYLNAGSGNNVEQFMDLCDLQKEIVCCLGRMPVKYSQVYILNRQRGFTVKKVAEMLHRPVDTVEKQLRKAIHQMRTHLIEYRIS